MPVSNLFAHLGFWLRMVSNHVSHAFAAKLAANGVTVAEWALMRTLYRREPIAPSRVAAELGMTRGAITKLADRLIAKSLVVRASSEEDGRAQTLALTEKAARLIPPLAALADQNDSEFFDCLTDRERQTLEKLLKRLVERNQLKATPVD
jgi:DNA-binding MarR family transcriptional regulator